MTTEVETPPCEKPKNVGTAAPRRTFDFAGRLKKCQRRGNQKRS